VQNLDIDETIDKSKIIYVCLDGIGEISKKIFREREKKFRIIVECIFRDQTNKDIYEKYANYKGTAAIKLSKGRENFILESIQNNEYEYKQWYKPT